MIDSLDAIFYLYKVKSSNHNRLLLSFSERAGIRTPDNLIKSQVLYHLSYTPVSFYSLFANKNAQNRNRTSDTRIFSPLLYQLSYLGIDYKSLSCGSRIWTCDLRVMSPTSFQTAPSRDIKLNSHKRKADDRTRTDNLLITNQLLCQLSHIGL